MRSNIGNKFHFEIDGNYFIGERGTLVNIENDTDTKFYNIILYLNSRYQLEFELSFTEYENEGYNYHRLINGKDLPADVVNMVDKNYDDFAENLCHFLIYI